MNMYRIEWMERKTTAVGDKWNCTLSSNGVSQEGCTLWLKDWPVVTLGQEVPGDLVTKVNGQFTNRTLYPGKTYKAFAAKPGAIKEAMTMKQEGIAHAQDNKAEGIKISSTIRMAVDCAIAEYDRNDATSESLTALIQRWRAYLWNEWDNTSSISPFNG